MKHVIFAFAALLTVLAAVDIIVLNDVTRGMLAVVLASSILVLGKLDTLISDRYADRKQENEDLVATLVDKVCDECQGGKELYLNQENFYCHVDGPLDKYYEVCKAHALHDYLNSWAIPLETGK
jgi:hypothetical protein